MTLLFIVITDEKITNAVYEGKKLTRTNNNKDILVPEEALAECIISSFHLDLVESINYFLQVMYVKVEVPIFFF